MNPSTGPERDTHTGIFHQNDKECRSVKMSSYVNNNKIQMNTDMVENSDIKI